MTRAPLSVAVASHLLSSGPESGACSSGIAQYFRYFRALGPSSLGPDPKNVGWAHWRSPIFATILARLSKNCRPQGPTHTNFVRPQKPGHLYIGKCPIFGYFRTPGLMPLFGDLTPILRGRFRGGPNFGQFRQKFWPGWLNIAGPKWTQPNELFRTPKT